MLRSVTILFGWGWALLNGAAYTLAQPDYLEQLDPVARAIPGFDRQVAALALIPTVPGLDSQTSAITLVLAGVVVALLGHAWSAGKPTSRSKVVQRISEISDAIVSFARERERDDLGVGTTGDPFFDTEDSAAQSRKSLALYEERFGPDVHWARSALARFGVTDAAFDVSCEDPGDTSGIRILGAHLGTLAKRLKRLRK
jgi:hypothetical protein